MKGIVLLALLSMNLIGCAMSAPKEDLHDIFALVKQKKFDEAKNKVQNGSKGLMGTFSTYSGEVLDPANQGHSTDNVSALIEGARHDIVFCDGKVQETKKIHESTVGNDQDELDVFKRDFDELQDDFERQCMKNEMESYSPIQKIKGYAAVDLTPIFLSDKAQFDKEVSRIKSEIARHEKQQEKTAADEQATEERYQQSPEFYSKKLCEMRAIVNAANSNIAEENEAAKSSGYVDKVKMYENGRAIQINTENIKRFSTEYKNKFRKTWTSAQCK